MRCRGRGRERVRDLSPRAQTVPAIVFVDEIDSIGRKRGAGLGGGSRRARTDLEPDVERDGWLRTDRSVRGHRRHEPPRRLGPGAAAPGPLRREIVVPLLTLEERLPILEVHAKGKPLDASVDLMIVARGTPGMSGADLANLVNEAALQPFDRKLDHDWHGGLRILARTRGPDGSRARHHGCSRTTNASASPFTRAVTPCWAYRARQDRSAAQDHDHPRGMALGVTMTLPEEESPHHGSPAPRGLPVHAHGRDGSRNCWSTATCRPAPRDDLQRNTELARRMVREWGMSKEIGPMAWARTTSVLG